MECKHHWAFTEFTQDCRIVPYIIYCIECEYELTADQVIAALNNKQLALRLVEEGQQNGL